MKVTWSRRISRIEDLMIEVLKEHRNGLALHQIVEEIRNIEPDYLRGETPGNSLYSIVYRREKRRIDSGRQPLFEKYFEQRKALYKLNRKKK